MAGPVTSVPAGGDWLKDGLVVQLSMGKIPLVKSGRVAWQKAFPSAVMFVGQEKLGGVESTTVITWLLMA